MRKSARNWFYGILMVGVSGAFSVSQCVPPAKPAASAASSESAPANKASDASTQEPAVSDQKPAPDAKSTEDAANQAKSDKQNKKDKKQKKEKHAQQDPVNTDIFNAAAAQDVLGLLRDGLEGHSQRLMLSAFDDQNMDGYLAFEDQIEAFFNKYEGFTVHFRISQTSTEGPKGIVLVDIEMEEIPRGGAAPPIRKNTEMRFELEHGRKGWKIVDFRPRGFFS